MSATAVAHDYLLVMRGAERTFHAISECFDEASIYTLLYDEPGTERRFAGRTMHTSPLQRLPIKQRGFRRLLPVLPMAARTLDARDHDVVVSSSSAFAHGLRVRPDAVHVCYCYTPFRYAWHERERALEEAPAPLRRGLDVTLDAVKRWDLKASSRVTHYIAISELSRRRIKEAYGRDAPIIHPPVELDRFSIGQPEDYLLVVCELVSHKRVDVALEAARLARMPIKVAGGGPEAERLQAVYGGSAEFVGRVSDEELAALYEGAAALVVPNVEEFGIAAVEAQACGRPVIGANAGGLQETVIHGTTGILVDDATPEGFAAAIAAADFGAFDPHVIRENAQRFSKPAFQRRLRAEVERAAGG
jgi:glycosyltransferase involved in cell wall biosynthesis